MIEGCTFGKLAEIWDQIENQYRQTYILATVLTNVRQGVFCISPKEKNASHKLKYGFSPCMSPWFGSLKGLHEGVPPQSAYYITEALKNHVRIGINLRPIIESAESVVQQFSKSEKPYPTKFSL